MKKVKINYNDTFGTMHSRDYYRGASFHFSGKWISGAHYVSDDYNIDFVVHGQTLLACAKSHLSSLNNEPTEFITDESGTIIGVISTYWDFVLSGIVGNSPGVKIIDNYWYICKNTGVPEEEQVWENTGVKAKMELSDLSPEEIALLQEPGKQVVTEFVNNTITQETGQNIDKIMSQKAVTDALSTKATVSQVTSAIANEVQRADLAYQPKGDYATNTTVNANKEDADNKFTAVNERIDTTNENVSDNTDAIQEEIENRESEIERIEDLISAEETSRVESDNALSNRISQEATARSTADNNLEQSIANINSKIPSEATAFNQLADKDFVHNEISTSSATFRGTYNTLVELEVQEADNNDYGFVVHTDVLGNTIYSRYKYNDTEWLWEYDITSTEFSQSQWEAVNSGINSTLVTKLSDLPTNADLTAALNNKVDKVTGKALSKINDIVVADANSEKTMTISKNDGSSDLVVDLGAKFSAAEKTKLEALPTKAELDTALDAKVDKAGNESETSEFVFRQTGAGLDIDAKNARIESFKGKTLAWNQLVKNGNFAEGTTNWFPGFGSIAVSGGILTYTVNTPTTGLTLFQSNFPDIVNHKYLFAAELNYSVKPTPISENNGFLGIGGYYGVIWYIQSIVPNSWFKVSGIITSNGDAATKDLRIYLRTTGMSAGDTVQIKNVIAIDLTLMFGEGHEPSTVAEFEALYPGYHAYNPGALISNDAESLETVGFNKWDEEWELGVYNASTGTKLNSNTQIRCKNLIPIQPNTIYYKKSPGPGVFWNIYYDANKNYLNYSAAGYNAEFRTPANAYYMAIYTEEGYGTTYNHDICINIFDPSRNGQYEPYRKSVLPLNIKTRTGKLNGQGASVVVFPDGMNGVGTSFDESNRTRAIKRRSRVNLGSLTWSMGTYGSFNRFNADFTDGKQGQSVVSEAKAITPLYVASRFVTDAAENASDKTFNLVYNNIFILDNSFSDAATFKAAMDGVYLDYELANEEIYELAEPLRTDYIVDKLGTERVIAESPICPFRADIHYYESSVKDIEIENMPQYLKREELTDELDKLQDIESGAQVNTIEHIKINDTEQTISNKTVNLPAYPTSLPASDVYDWAKASTKPSYNFSEIRESVANSQLPSSISIENITASGQLSGNAFKVIAEHIAKLTARVEVLEAGVGTLDTLTSNSIDSANGYYINGDKTVIIGSGAPTMIPAFAGQFYINTSGPALYYAVNNSATTDWKQA